VAPCQLASRNATPRVASIPFKVFASPFAPLSCGCPQCVCWGNGFTARCVHGSARQTLCNFVRVPGPLVPGDCVVQRRRHLVLIIGAPDRYEFDIYFPWRRLILGERRRSLPCTVRQIIQLLKKPANKIFTRAQWSRTAAELLRTRRSCATVRD